MNPETLTKTPIRVLYERTPWIDDFFSIYSLEYKNIKEQTLSELVASFDDNFFEENAVTHDGFVQTFLNFFKEMHELVQSGTAGVQSVSILPGRDKTGTPEIYRIDFVQGEVNAIVGPTGSGKSRLLADIECLAQCDTPTGRKILLNDSEPTEELRFETGSSLVAQLSQNMNFVMDLSVEDFVTMHAESRMVENISHTVDKIYQQANELAGEGFAKSTPLTELSGGQSRALMIADTALLSSAPIILIDEIENAGVDKSKALSLLVKSSKIILVATHDPLLALAADKRIVIKNGGISKLLHTSDKERMELEKLKELDSRLNGLRNRLRSGEIISSF